MTDGLEDRPHRVVREWHGKCDCGAGDAHAHLVCSCGWQDTLPWHHLHRDAVAAARAHHPEAVILHPGQTVRATPASPRDGLN